ncbi:MAG: TdeIII family type II restriction endonuclease [Chloroflexi bacterium]|nr:TdeIII family type II restriction endonuclease [Chloroflexota bacterium]
MAALSELTRTLISAHLEVFVENLVNDYRNRAVEPMVTPAGYLSRTDAKGSLKPFHAAIVPSEVLRISAFERGLVTRLGSSLEQCALLIARQRYPEAQRGYELSGDISTNALAEIDRQLDAFERVNSDGKRRPALNDMVDAVLRVNSGGPTAERRKKVDLFLRSSSGSEYYFEMKSPKPNKDQCARITQGILQVHALRQQARPKVRSYLAFPYNPYGNSRADYNWSYPKNYLPFDEAVLVGDEFWTLLGGPGAYEELLEIYHYVGRVKGKFIAEALAFGN